MYWAVFSEGVPQSSAYRQAVLSEGVPQRGAHRSFATGLKSRFSKNTPYILNTEPEGCNLALCIFINHPGTKI